jgi:hypothetical protein
VNVENRLACESVLEVERSAVVCAATGLSRNRFERAQRQVLDLARDGRVETVKGVKGLEKSRPCLQDFTCLDALFTPALQLCSEYLNQSKFRTEVQI